MSRTAAAHLCGVPLALRARSLSAARFGGLVCLLGILLRCGALCGLRRRGTRCTRVAPRTLQLTPARQLDLPLPLGGVARYCRQPELLDLRAHVAATFRRNLIHRQVFQMIWDHVHVRGLGVALILCALHRTHDRVDPPPRSGILLCIDCDRRLDFVEVLTRLFVRFHDKLLRGR